MGDAEEDLYLEEFRNLVDTVFELCQTELKSADSQRIAVLY